MRHTRHAVMNILRNTGIAHRTKKLALAGNPLAWFNVVVAVKRLMNITKADTSNSGYNRI